MNTDSYQCELDNSTCGYVVVQFHHHKCPLLYETDNRVRREVKVWLRDNVGTRALTLEHMQDTTLGHQWLVLQGTSEPLTELQEMQLPAMDHMHWRHRSYRVYFYFRTMDAALLFKLTWGGA